MEIKRRIDMLTPENSFVIFISKTVEKENVDLQKERWYSTLYTSSNLQDDLVREL